MSLVWLESLVTPRKTNERHWKISMFNGRYIFKWWIFHCHLIIPGGTFFVLSTCTFIPTVCRLPSHLFCSVFGDRSPTEIRMNMSHICWKGSRSGRNDSLLRWVCLVMSKWGFRDIQIFPIQDDRHMMIPRWPVFFSYQKNKQRSRWLGVACTRQLICWPNWGYSPSKWPFYGL